MIVMIADVRFINEADYIKNNNGLLIRIEAPDRNNDRLNKESNNDEIIK